jgi:hypothetical protein
MTSISGPFPDDQQITTRWGVTFTPWHDPDDRVGFRADRDGLTHLVYLTLPADPGNGRTLTVDVCSRPDAAGKDDPDTHTAAVRLDIVGPVTAHPWTDGFSVGWRVEGLHHTRYVHLTPSVDGDWGEDVADVHVYLSDSDDPTDASPVLWLPVHDRTAEPLIAAGPVTGPGITFDPAAFADWFRTTDAQQDLPGLPMNPYDSSDANDSAGLRAQMLLLDGLPPTVWRLDAAVSDVVVWPTIDPEGAAAGDGGALITVRYGPVDLSAGRLAADELIRRVYVAANGTVKATALHAAIQILTAIAIRVNDTVQHFLQVTGQTGTAATTPTAAATPDAGEDDSTTAGSHVADEPVTAAADDDTSGGVPISLVTGWTTTTINVNPDLEDAVVFVTAGDPTGYPLDIVGIDFNAGTVGIWTGPDPDNQEWTVVHHLDSDAVRAQIQAHHDPIRDQAEPSASA